MKDPTIDRIDVSAYTIPIDFPESDAHGGGQSGPGYTHGDLAATSLIERLLANGFSCREQIA